MNPIDILIIAFLAFVIIGFSYNKFTQIKKAKKKGISASCCGCRYSSQCAKANNNQGITCASKDIDKTFTTSNN